MEIAIAITAIIIIVIGIGIIVKSLNEHSATNAVFGIWLLIIGLALIFLIPIMQFIFYIAGEVTKVHTEYDKETVLIIVASLLTFLGTAVFGICGFISQELLFKKFKSTTESKQQLVQENKNSLSTNKISIEMYLSERIDNQIKWYDKKAIQFKRNYELLSLLNIIVSALITILSGLFISPTSIAVIIAILSAGITVSNLVITLKKYQELHLQYRLVCEKLKQEKYLYLTKSGDYQSTSSVDNIDNLFIERMESIMTTEVGNWSQLNEKKRS